MKYFVFFYLAKSFASSEAVLFLFRYLVHSVDETSSQRDKDAFLFLSKKKKRVTSSLS